MKRKKNFILTAIMLSAVMMFTGCGGNQQASGTSAGGSSETASGDSASDRSTSKETITLRLAQDPSSVNTGTLSANTPQEPVQDLVVETLTRYYDRDNDGYAELENLLITEIVEDEDQLGFTVTIRDDVTFSNGNPMTAEDVAYSFTDVFNGSSRAVRYPWFDFGGVEVVDDTHVHFPLNYYSCTYAGDLANMGIYEKANCEANKDDPDLYTTKSVATGPYVVDTWTTNDRVVLKKNTNYWGEEPIIDEVIFRVISESSVALMELQSTGIDVFLEADALSAQQIEGMDGFETYTNIQEQSVFLGFNYMNEALQDLRVRQAICHAIDPEAIIEGSANGGAFYPYSAYSVTGESAVTWEPEDWPYNYDPEKAKELLAEAGYESGLELTLLCESLAARQSVATQIANMLNEVGINCTLDVVESSVIANIFQNEGDSYDLYIRRSGGPGSAGQNAFFAYNNDYTYSHVEEVNPEIGEELTTILGTGDDEERQAMWEEFQNKAVNEYLFSIPIYQEYNYVLHNSSLQGVTRARWYYNVSDWYFE